MLEIIGGLGTFVEHPGRSMLILSTDSVFCDSIENHTNGHEMIHLKFWAYRKGLKPDFLPKAPVHASYQTEQAINPSATIGIYQHYMSFEELVTFAFNVSRKAEGLAAAPSDERVASELRFEIKKMRVVSENTILASEKALIALKTHSAQRISYPGQLSGDFFEITKSGSTGFSLQIFLSSEEQKQCGADCRSVLEEKLAHTIKLAKFNLAYFSEESFIDESILRKLTRFEHEQLTFIENLK